MYANPFDVSNNVILISGSSRGIGLEVAKGFLQSGAKVTISGNDEAELNETYKELHASYKDKVHYVKCDVRSENECKQAIELTVGHFGKLDTIICNAGVDRIKEIAEYTEGDWDFIVDINLKGAFFFAQPAIKYFLKNHIKGNVILTSSICGTIGVPGLVPYSASKGGVEQLVKTMAVELAKTGIRVNGVAPGYVQNVMSGVNQNKNSTDERVEIFTPMGRRCKTSELAGPFIFLSSTASSYITGHILRVDGGYSAQ